MKLATPMLDLLCSCCRGPETSVDDHLNYYETTVELGGAEPLSVPLDVKQVDLQWVSDNTFAATAIVAPMCPDCSQPHELRYYLQAVRVFIRSVQGCPECNGEMELRQQDFAYKEDENGPQIKLRGELSCPKCRISVSLPRACEAPSFEDIARAGSIIVDLDVGQATALPTTTQRPRFAWR